MTIRHDQVSVLFSVLRWWGGGKLFKSVLEEIEDWHSWSPSLSDLTLILIDLRFEVGAVSDIEGGTKEKYSDIRNLASGDFAGSVDVTSVKGVKENLVFVRIV